MPIINYAHRGASKYYPENTLRAFYAGLEMRADGIETDIRRTADGVLVLHHDNTLKRITGQEDSISDYTYAQLLKMDFGAFKGERFAGERIVTLDTFLHHFGAMPLYLALEIKQSGVEEQTLECIRTCGCRDRVTVTSFELDSLLAVRGLDADIALGYLTEQITVETLDLLQEHRIGQICPRVDKTGAQDVALARARGFSVRFWGVASEELMRYALTLDSDGMTIDFPDKLTDALAAM